MVSQRGVRSYMSPDNGWNWGAIDGPTDMAVCHLGVGANGMIWAGSFAGNVYRYQP